MSEKLKRKSKMENCKTKIIELLNKGISKNQLGNLSILMHFQVIKLHMRVFYIL